MDIESRIASLEARNIRVEADKKWETSVTRRISILIMTYGALGLYMYFLGVERWYFHALVPTVGYFLSTLALPFVRKIWNNIQK